MNQAQEVRNAVEPCRLLIVGAHDIPGSMLSVCRFHHQIPSMGVFVPAAVGFQIHRAQFPLSKWVLDACLKTLLLFFLAYFHPVLDQDCSTIHHVFFYGGTKLEKTAMLFLAAETHHILNSGAVVPTPVKDHDLSGCGKVLNITL